MKLFFETAFQADFYLKTVALGFLLAICLDVLSARGHFSVIVDITVFALLGSCFILLLILFQLESIRLYHVLGCITGSILYTLGLAKVVRGFVTKIKRRKVSFVQEKMTSFKKKNIS